MKSEHRRNGLDPKDPCSRLVNGPSGSVTHQAAVDFISIIDRARKQGFGFVPFLGAGFSAPSGAPLVTELKSYLERCVCMALGAEEPDMYPWDPRTDQWPPFIDRSPFRANISEGHWSNKIKEVIDRIAQGADGYAERKEDLPVLAQGWGAAAEWRTALLFLSRLNRESRTFGLRRQGPVSLSASQPEIIDSCFREVLRGKYPALGHRMLAVLAGAMRLDLVLTTNFDDLLERAFASARNNLEVFEVPLGGNLPHWSAVSDVRSLIKLHGSRHSLRADYSLDELPSEADKKRFFERSS